MLRSLLRHFPPLYIKTFSLQSLLRHFCNFFWDKTQTNEKTREIEESIGERKKRSGKETWWIEASVKKECSSKVVLLLVLSQAERRRHMPTMVISHVIANFRLRNISGYLILFLFLSLFNKRGDIFVYVMVG